MLNRLPKPRLPAHFDALAGEAASRLPAIAARTLAALPVPLERPVIERLLNRALAQPLADGRFDFLFGHSVTIALTDGAWSMSLTSSEAGVLQVTGTQGAETRISASALDFLGLIAGHIDPDTLFFQRRLCMEGNVALGLSVKNTLDGVDRTAFPPPLRAALRLLRLTFAHFESGAMARAQLDPSSDAGASEQSA